MNHCRAADAGRSAEEGPIQEADHPTYRYANGLSGAAEALGKGAYLYSLGFFHSLHDGDIGFDQRFFKELENAGYYEVGDPDSITYLFEQIAQEETKRSGLFRYPISNASGADGGASYHYDDAYFYHDAYR